MPIGKIALSGLGRLGGGLGSVFHGNIGGAPPSLETAIILEDETGYILLEDNNLIITET